MNKKKKIVLAFGLAAGLVSTVSAISAVSLIKTQKPHNQNGDQTRYDLSLTTIGDQTKGALDEKINEEAKYHAKSSNISGFELINQPSLKSKSIYLASNTIKNELNQRLAKIVKDSKNKVISADVNSYIVQLFQQNESNFSINKTDVQIATSDSDVSLSVGINANYEIKNNSKNTKTLLIENHKFDVSGETTLKLNLYTDRNLSFLKEATPFIDQNNNLNWSMDRIYVHLESKDGLWRRDFITNNFVFNKEKSALNTKISDVKDGYSEYDAIKNFVGENKLLNNNLNESNLKDSLRHNFEDKFNLAKQYAGYIYSISNWMINHRSETFDIANFLYDNAKTISEVIIFGLEKALKTSEVKKLETTIYDILTSWSAKKNAKSIYKIIWQQKDVILNFLKKTKLVDLSAYQSIIDDFFNTIKETNPNKAALELQDKVIQFIPTIKNLVKPESPFYPYLDLLLKVLNSKTPYFIDSVIKDSAVFKPILDLAFDKVIPYLDPTFKQLVIQHKQTFYDLLINNTKTSLDDLLLPFFANNFETIISLLKMFNININLDEPMIKFVFDNFIKDNKKLKDKAGLDNIVAILSDLIQLISPENLAKISFTPLDKNNNPIEIISTNDELKIKHIDYGYSVKLDNLVLKNSTVLKLIDLIPEEERLSKILDKFFTDQAIDDTTNQAWETARNSQTFLNLFNLEATIKPQIKQNIVTLKNKLAEANLKNFVKELIFGNLNPNPDEAFFQLKGNIDVSLTGDNLQVLPYYTQKDNKMKLDYQILGIQKEINIGNLQKNSKLLNLEYTNNNPVITYMDLSKQIFNLTRQFYKDLSPTFDKQSIKLVDNLALSFSNPIYLDNKKPINRIVKNAYMPGLTIKDLTKQKQFKITSEEAIKDWNTTDLNNIKISDLTKGKFANYISVEGVDQRYLTQLTRPFSTGKLNGNIQFSISVQVAWFWRTEQVNAKLSIEGKALAYDLILPYNAYDVSDANNPTFSNKVSKTYQGVDFNFAA
ncbi:P116 family lipid acquisition surface protein [Mycoplasma sp. E35C]|uniref:P116 family lipid acquisition surface protein n=1 Tax=Mycoplasma sp. E35C TaxID=2801918 RepID=UPI001CA3DB4D|nr:hypothetical protein [Mycoplasma sp. E35C]QZX49316.1 hypothetical protein JJE79_00995 [Mycoplasma sp. E35C]